jgi:hypothetical protein
MFAASISAKTSACERQARSRGVIARGREKILPNNPLQEVNLCVLRGGDSNFFLGGDG